MNAPLPFPEPIRLTPELRKKLEAAVDKLLTLLDATAEDPDLEPSPGSVENHSFYYGSVSDSFLTRWCIRSAHRLSFSGRPWDSAGTRP